MPIDPYIVHNLNMGTDAAYEYDTSIKCFGLRPRAFTFNALGRIFL
jgi:hypothetical protein